MASLRTRILRTRIDLSTKKVLMLALVIQIAILGILGLKQLGIDLLGVRQIIGFFYLCFVPGLLILRILRLHVSVIETTLYSVGLSISVVMFSGALINFLYPLLGISKPISETLLVISYSAIVLTLVLLGYLRDKDYSRSFLLDINKILHPAVLFSLLLPILATLGALYVNLNDSNILLLFLLATISLTPILVVYDKIPLQILPLTVWGISLALLFHNSLISKYIWGVDINSEYYFANLVNINHFLDPSIQENVNAMFSVVILAPVFSIICDVSLTWVFKIIYPLLFSFIPLGLYQIYRQQTDDKIAFVSCFFFMSFFTFFTEMLTLARQEIAELYLLLLLLPLFNMNMNNWQRKALLITFASSLIVSHYGVSYLFMLYIIAGLFLVLLLKKVERIELFTPAFASLYIIATITYYIHVTRGSIFSIGVGLAKNIVMNLGDLFNPFTSHLIYYMTRKLSPLYEVFRILNYVSTFFSCIGIITLLLKRKEFENFNVEFKVLSVLSFGTYFLCFLPWFSMGASFSFTRIYHLTLFSLSPMSVIGGKIIIDMIFKSIYRKSKSQLAIKGLALFFAIYLLFSSSFIFELAGDYSTSISLSQRRVKESKGLENIMTRIAFYNAYIPEDDVFSARWLAKYWGNPSRVYADVPARYNVLTSYGSMLHRETCELEKNTKVADNSIIFLRRFNYLDGIMIGPSLSNWWNITEIQHILDKGNMIYCNGGSAIYYIDMYV